MKQNPRKGRRIAWKVYGEHGYNVTGEPTDEGEFTDLTTLKGALARLRMLHSEAKAWSAEFVDEEAWGWDGKSYVPRRHSISTTHETPGGSGRHGACPTCGTTFPHDHTLCRQDADTKWARAMRARRGEDWDTNPPAGKPKNPHRINLAQMLRQHGYDSLDEMLASGALEDSVVPALCDEGCEVEPDGRCEHGCPSVVLALGFI